MGPHYAAAGALALLLLSAAFAWLRLRHRDAGAGWFCASYFAIGTVYVFDAVLRPTERHANPVSVMLVGFVALGLSAGLAAFLGERGARRRRWLALQLAPYAVLAATAAVMPVSRVWAYSTVSLVLALQALMTFLAGRREPGVGHGVLALALLSYPAAFAASRLLGTPVDAFRYLAIVPLTVVGVALIVIDLSRARLRLQAELAARRQAEDALRQLNDQLEQRVAHRTEELGDLVAGLESFNRMVSHDLRGPLAGLAGLSDLIEQSLDEGRIERARELLGLMGGQTRRLSTLVTDLLMLSRLADAGLRREAAPLDEPVHEALQALAVAQGGKPLPPVSVATLPAASFDRSLMRQVFVNLIGNALKFTRDTPEPRIEVAAEQRGGDIVVCVRDNGAGFDSARAADLFQPFKRLHAGYEGSGIGLTIVRRIVEQHGGRAWAEGAPGQGARFYVSIPSS